MVEIKQEKLMQVIEPFKKRFDSFISRNNFAFLYDDDPDGICSAVLLKKYLESLGKKVSVMIPFSDNPQPFSEKFNEIIKNSKAESLIILDFDFSGFGFFESFKNFKSLFPEINVMLIDHHKDDFEYSDIEIINSKDFFKEIPSSQFCTTKIIYELIKDFPERDSFDWIYAIGLIADFNHITWLDDIKKIATKQNMVLVKNDENEIIIPEDVDEVYATPYGKSSNFMFYGIAKDRNEINKITLNLYKSKNVFEFYETLQEYVDVKEDVYDHIDNLEYFKKTNSGEDLKIFEMEVKSDSDIESILSNLLSQKEPDILFFIYHLRKDGYVYTSVRHQNSNLDLGEVIKKCITFSEGNAGGHKPAAGARVLKKDFRQFKDNFYNEIEKVKL